VAVPDRRLEEGAEGRRCSCGGLGFDEAKAVARERHAEERWRARGAMRGGGRGGGMGGAGERSGGWRAARSVEYGPPNLEEVGWSGNFFVGTGVKLSSSGERSVRVVLDSETNRPRASLGLGLCRYSVGRKRHEFELEEENLW
jgi:hypothetical protein